MALELILIDFSKTICSPTSIVFPLMREAIARLRGYGIRVAIVTNERTDKTAAALHRARIEVDLVLGSDAVGAKKPSPVCCYKAMAHFGVQPNECAYLGDDDKTDALCAVNAGLLYLSARWANPTALYGLPCDTPDSLIRFVVRFLLQPPFWYQQVVTRDRLGRPVEMLGMYRTNRASTLLKDVLKFGFDLKVGAVGARGFLFRRLLASLYCAGLTADIDYWTWYPSHDGSPIRAKHSIFLQQTTRLFRDRYLPDLFVRHSPATKSAFARAKGVDPGFLNQMNSIHLNPAYRDRIVAKRILVVDDFSTKGYSFECARNLLLAAGAASVMGVCFARYHDYYVIQTPRRGLVIVPWEPMTFVEGDFVQKEEAGEYSGLGDDDIRLLTTLNIPPLGT
jgi:hypothetical protein